MTTVYREALQSDSLPPLEKDMDDPLQLGQKEVEATACWQAPMYDDYDSDSNNDVVPFMGCYQGLMITKAVRVLDRHENLQTT